MPSSRKSKTGQWIKPWHCRPRAGLDVLTDGEMRRYAFYGHLIDATEGFDKFGGWAIPFHDEQGNEVVIKRPVVVSRLARVRPMCEEEFTFLRARTEHPKKVTIISAQQAAAYYAPDKSSGAYATIDAYLADVVDILRGGGGGVGPSRLHLHPG